MSKKKGVGSRRAVGRVLQFIDRLLPFSRAKRNEYLYICQIYLLAPSCCWFDVRFDCPD